MTEKQSTYDEAAIATVAGLAQLDLPPERVAQVVAAGAPTHALIKELNAIDLGEAAPAASFAASWE